MMIILVLLGLLLHAEEVPQSQWSFSVKKERKSYALGLVKPRDKKAVLADKSFLIKEEKVPAKFDLKSKVELSPIFDQGSCGSCVYNSVTKNLEDSYRLRGIVHPRLSRQFIMDCGAEWSCNGSYFEKVAQGVLEQKGTATEANYPYRARDQRCQKPVDVIAPIVSYKVIDNSPKSIMSALLAGYPVSVTVGAGGSFMGYDSGIFNACSNVGTNHEVLIYGWDCESSVDKDGNCVFDANGKLPAGVGYWIMPNSWGVGWGEDGVMRIKMTSKSGSLCNNLAEEAGILETGIPVPKPPEPPAPVPPGPVPPVPDESGIPLWVFILSGFGLLVVGSIVFKLISKKENN